MFNKKMKIDNAVGICQKVAQGNFEQRILDIKKAPKDLQPLFNAINDLIDRSDAYVRESATSLAHVTEGKYWRKIIQTGMNGSFANSAKLVNDASSAMDEKVVQFSGVADNFENTIKGVVQTVAGAATELQSSSMTMSEIASNTSAQATTVAAAAEEASANVQTVAAAAEELSASVGEISRQVSQSAEQTKSATEQGKLSTKQVKELSEASDKIGEVVSFINDIAGQTNLLALNATIEAARAGESGKGFAVVATEVKNLAGQTAKATEDISAHVTAIQRAVSESEQSINMMTNTIGDINESSSAISAAVEEQSAATSEIARNVEQAAQGTDDVTKNITEVTMGADATGDSAGEVLNAAEELSKQAELMQSEIDTFLIEMRKVI